METKGLLLLLLLLWVVVGERGVEECCLLHRKLERRGLFLDTATRSVGFLASSLEPVAPQQCLQLRNV